MAVFRFLVNVDKCIDMSHYKCFFYKLKSSGTGKRSRFHHSEAQFLAGDPLSFRKAVADIRMYLDRYPYDVEDYRIILMMRDAYTNVGQTWEASILCKLLRLRYEFSLARIMLSSSLEAQRENALNFVMLYDTDFSAALPTLEPYFTSNRMRKDMELLLEKFDIPNDQQGIFQIAEKLDAASLSDGDTSIAAEADFLHQYLTVRKDSDASLEGTENTAALLTAFAKELFANYRVYERFINRSDRREETMSFLRLTDFINHDTEATFGAGHIASASTLAQRCDAAWDAIWRDPDAKDRFACMLAAYSNRLDHAEKELGTLAFPPDVETRLPSVEVPGENAISSDLENFDEDSKKKIRRQGVLEKLEKYKKRGLFRKSFREDWNTTCKEIVEVLNDMKGSLQLFAQDLSNQYIAILTRRKKETAAWKIVGYAAEPKEKEQLDIIQKEKQKILTALKRPHMNPGLSFQDVLNSERSLEKHSMDISFYLDCIKATTVANFLLLMLVCGGFFVLHYTLLQPYVLTDFKALPIYLAYIGAAIVMMGTAFVIPYRHYKKSALKSIDKLYEELKVYIRGYEERAAYFSEYINNINRLDSLNRYYDLYDRALKNGHMLKSGQLWHRDQIRKHKEMLIFFEGLIASASDAGTEGLPVVTVFSEGELRDVADCPIYWPQG